MIPFLLLLLPAALVLSEGPEDSCTVPGSNESEEGLDRMELFQIDLHAQRSEGRRRAHRRRRRTPPVQSTESFGECVFLFTKNRDYYGTTWIGASGKPQSKCTLYSGGSGGSLIGKVTPRCIMKISYGTTCARHESAVLMRRDDRESTTGSVSNMAASKWHGALKPMRSVECSCLPPTAALAEQQAELLPGGNESAQVLLPGAEEVEEQGGEESEEEGMQQVEEEGEEEEESSQPEQEEGESTGAPIQDGVVQEGIPEEVEGAENATEQLFRSGNLAFVTKDACHWVFYKHADYAGYRWHGKAQRGECVDYPAREAEASSGVALVEGGCRLVLYDGKGCPRKHGNWVRLAPLSGQYRSENTVRVHSRFERLQSFGRPWNDRVLSAKCECQYQGPLDR